MSNFNLFATKLAGNLVNRLNDITFNILPVHWLNDRKSKI